MQEKPLDSTTGGGSPLIDSSSELTSQITSKPPLYSRSLFASGLDRSNLHRVSREEFKREIRSKVTLTTDRTQSRVLSIADISLRDGEETNESFCLEERNVRERFGLFQYKPSN